MAHRIYTADKQQGVEVAWHGLTQLVPEISLEDNWLTQWDLVPRRLQLDGVDTKWSVLRCSDDPTIEIGQPYNPETFHPVDNKDFLDLVRQSISGTAHQIVSVGSVRNRGRVFVSIRLHGMETFKAAGRDFSAYLNFGNGHDKSSVLWVNTSNICTVCDNTFGFNLLSVENKGTGESDESEVKLRQRHTKNVKMKLPGIAELVDKAVGVQGEFQVTMETLGETRLVHLNAQQLFAGFLGRRIPVAERKNGLSTRANNTVNRMMELFQTGRGNRGETLADAFGAATDYYTHESSIGDGNVARQFLSSEYGAGRQAKQEFLRIISDPFSLGETEVAGEELLANTKTK